MGKYKPGHGYYVGQKFKEKATGGLMTLTKVNNTRCEYEKVGKGIYSASKRLISSRYTPLEPQE